MDHIVASTDKFTGAQLEELANTIYILAINGENDAATGGGSESGSISVNRELIERAVDEVRVERKTRLGFHAA
jgi:hypothetical protein